MLLLYHARFASGPWFGQVVLHLPNVGGRCRVILLVETAPVLIPSSRIQHTYPSTAKTLLPRAEGILAYTRPRSVHCLGTAF